MNGDDGERSDPMRKRAVHPKRYISTPFTVTDSFGDRTHKVLKMHDVSVVNRRRVAVAHCVSGEWRSDVLGTTYQKIGLRRLSI